MTSDAENRRSRSGSPRKELLTVLLIWALLAAVFAPVFALAQASREAPDGKVFCPLSGRFQPVKPPERTKVREPFDYLCASRKTKDFLFGEMILKNPFRVFSLDTESFEKLAFEILADGKTAFKKSPFSPGKPLETSTRQLASGIAVKNHNEPKTNWKYAFVAFSTLLAARPPTAEQSLFSPAQRSYRSTEISRHLAPRAPPFAS
jgi:hypothetical protein